MLKTSLRTLVLVLLALGLSMTTAGSSARGQRNPRVKKINPNWQVVKREQGIVVSIKEHPTRVLPLFRAVGVIEASIYEVLAVMGDVSQHTRWLESCIKSEMLAAPSETARILYNRTEAPWPVSDRDAVIYSNLTFHADKGEVWIRFRETTHPSRPETDAVRIPRLRGFQHLKSLGPNRTRFTYQVDADPGGFIPKWIVRIAQTSLPLNTLLRLRQQVKRTRGRYAGQVAEMITKYGEIAVPPG